MANDNTLTVSGNAGGDAEVRFTPSGTAVCSFSVAVNRQWRNKDTQEWEKSVSFFDVICWKDLAENVGGSVHKGDRVTVTGRLEQRTWETDAGEKRSKIEVVADDVALSLKWATGSVQRNQRDSDNGSRQPAQTSSRGSGGRAAPMAPEEEPFIVDAGSWWPDANLGVAPARMLP